MPPDILGCRAQSKATSLIVRDAIAALVEPGDNCRRNCDEDSQPENGANGVNGATHEAHGICSGARRSTGTLFHLDLSGDNYALSAKERNCEIPSSECALDGSQDGRSAPG